MKIAEPESGVPVAMLRCAFRGLMLGEWQAMLAA